MLDQRLGVAQRDGHGDQVQRVDQLGTGSAAALDLEAQHAAEVLHLAGGDIVAHVILQAGIVHLLHGGVLVKILGDGLGVGAVALHADLQRLEAPEDQIGGKGIHDRAGHVLQAKHADFTDKVGLAHHKARDHVAVAVQVLGSRVHHHVGAQRQRILQSGRSEGVVAHHLDGGVIGMGSLRHGGDVGDLQVGVGGGLQINGAGILLQSGLHGGQIGGIHEADLHAVAAHAVVQQGEGAAVQGAVGHDVLACTGDGPQRGGNGAHTGSGRHAGLAALQRRHLILQHGDGGVAQTGVDVAALLPGKAAAALLAAVEHEGRGLIDGGSQRAVLRVLHITGVNGLGAQTDIGVHHSLLLLHHDFC